MKKFIFLIIAILITGVSRSQEPDIIRILILDSKTQEPLPYANILFIHQGNGTISNEAGYFSINTGEFNENDSISIQYIGYKDVKVSFEELRLKSKIELDEELVNLSEAWVYGNPPNPKDIIEKLIEHKDQNYQPFSAKSQIFIRNRENTHFDQLDTYVKRNSINEIEEAMLERIVSRIPRNLTSFTDFLTYSYTHHNSFDSLKLRPLKTVSLQDLEIDEADQFGKIFETLFKETEDGEYWKVKSGIFGEKLDIDEPEENDSIDESNEHKNQMNTWSMKNEIISGNKYATLNDKDVWEFLYKTNKYKYKLIGGSKVNGEDVFIIDFTPKGGKYVGRVYVSTTTYALLKADFQYGEGKDGRDIQLLGIGYHEFKYRTSISYENVNDNYQLKYFSNDQAISYSFERHLALQKKKKRFLFDKKLKEIQLKLDIAAVTENSRELLVLNTAKISESEFDKIKHSKWTDVIYVDHFSDEYWKGYPIIEPTQQMREYQKQKIDWEELEK